MKVEFSSRFEKIYRKLNYQLYARILLAVNKIRKNPFIGKPLKYNLKNRRTFRVHPFRIIYTIDEDTIVFLDFDHRKDVYEKFCYAKKYRQEFL